MDLARLRHILAVAETGSFSRAAEEAHITQPALSRSIAGFERQYGVRLFDRGRSGVAVTAAGRLVMEQAQAMLVTAGELERSLRLYGKGEAGRVALGLGPMLASLLLPEVGRSLLASRPGLRIVTEVGSIERLLPRLSDGTLEMVFGNTWQIEPAPAIERRILGSLDLAVLARRGHPLAGKRDVAAADLAGFPTASSVELPSGGLGDRGGSFVCDNFHILREVVLGTDAVWRTTPAFVADELRDGALVILDVAELAVTVTDVCVAFPAGRSRSPACMAVVDEAVKALSGVRGAPR